MTATARAEPLGGQATWHLARQGDRWLLTLDGAIDARFEYGEILCAVVDNPDAVTCDLAGVTRIDCQGVSRLLRLVEAFAERRIEVTYRRCSLPVVTRINQVPLLLRHAAVESVFAPYCCEQTGEETLRLLDVTQIDELRAPPGFEDARGAWTFDELPARFFAFVQRGRWATPRPAADACDAAPLGEDR